MYYKIVNTLSVKKEESLEEFDWLGEAPPSEALMAQPFAQITLATIVTTTLLLFLPVITNAARINAALDQEEVYEGEPVHLVITILDAQDRQQPDLGHLKDFSVSSLGDRSMDSRSITIINGRRTEKQTFGHKYFYQLTPLTSGQLSIPPITAVGDGEQLTTTPLVLLVKPADAQDKVRLDIRIEPKSVYPTERFTIAVDLLVQELADDNASYDPLKIRQRDRPRLTIPWLEDDNLPANIEPLENWQSIVEPWIDKNSHGVQLNNFTANDGFGFSLFERRATSFLPDSSKITLRDNQGQEVGYWRYSFSRGFMAKTDGDFQLGAAKIDGEFAVGVRGKRAISERIYAITKPVTLHVKSVPVEDRPANYGGIIGRCEISTDVTPRETQVGAPITLTIKFRGKGTPSGGTLSSATAPDLSQIAGIAENFRIYEPTSELGDNQLSFTYSIRAVNENVEEFPSVEASYFDVEREKYVTLRSEPIPLKIEQSEQLASGQIVSSVNPRPHKTLESTADGVFANDSSLSSLRNEAIHVGRWAMGWGTMMGAYAIASLLIRHQQQLHRDPSRTRRRGAAEQARATMRQAAAATDKQATANAVRDSLVGLIAAVADQTAEGMTPRETHDQAISAGLDDSLAKQLQDLLEQCDAVRYATLDKLDNINNPSKLGGDSSRLLENVIQALNKKQMLR